MKDRNKHRTPLSRTAVGLLVVSVVVLCMVIPSLGGPRNPRMRVGSAKLGAPDSVETQKPKTFVDGFQTIVIFASNSVQTRQDAVVSSGDVVVNRAPAEEGTPILLGLRELDLGKQTVTPSTFFLKADRIRVRQDAVVDSDLFCNDISGPGSGGLSCRPTTLPAFTLLPDFSEYRVATEPPAPPVVDVTVKKNKTETIDEGDYNDVKVKEQGKLKLTGGIYNFRSLDLKLQAEVVALAPTEIRILERFSGDQESVVKGGSGVGADEVVLFVGGINGTDGALGSNPKAVDIGVQEALALGRP